MYSVDMTVPALPEPRERRTTSDYVVEALREAIITGRFEDGEELNQVELANHFKVSRVPVREALRRLQAEGLISAEAHRRAVVRGFTRDRISEIFEIRALLETYMLKRAAPDREVVAELRRMCDEMAGAPSHAEWLEHNHAFHRALLEPSGAKTALTLVEQLSRRVERYVRRSGGVHRTREVGEEHRQIVEALELADIRKAGDLLRRHILRSRDRVLDALPDVEPPAPDGS
jgi:DNA-binding GntR family transcriptional regulator